MTCTALPSNKERHSAQRRSVGVRLRHIAWIVLACWLFTLMVCAANDAMRAQIQNHHGEIVAHEHANDHFQPDDLAQHEDACCTVLESLSVSFGTSDIPLPVFNLAYIVLPFVFVLQAVLLAVARIRFAGTGPPGRPGRTLVANSLWPHAPPH